jgi:hypothetical protein
MPGTPSEVNLLVGPLVFWLLILTATVMTNWLTGWLERHPVPDRRDRKESTTRRVAIAQPASTSQDLGQRAA